MVSYHSVKQRMFFIASVGFLYCFVWGAFWNSGTKHQVITVPAWWNDVTIRTKPIWFNLFMCIRLVYKSSLCNRQLYKSILFVFSDSHVSLENMSCFHLQKLDCVENLVWYLLFYYMNFCSVSFCCACNQFPCFLSFVKSPPSSLTVRPCGFLCTSSVD